MKSKLITLLCLALLCNSCTQDENESTPAIDLTTQKTTHHLVVDLIYVLPSKITFEENLPSTVNGEEYIAHLNDVYFHQYDIGLVLGTTKNIQNDELFDLKDNRGNEVATFLKETKNSAHKNRLSIYVISRSNIIAIAGIGKEQRVLMTDENLYTTTSPHEIGHALGLFHVHEHDNIMHEHKAAPRHHFDTDQIAAMKKSIEAINVQ